MSIVKIATSFTYRELVVIVSYHFYDDDHIDFGLWETSVYDLKINVMDTSGKLLYKHNYSPPFNDSIRDYDIKLSKVNAHDRDFGDYFDCSISGSKYYKELKLLKRLPFTGILGASYYLAYLHCFGKYIDYNGVITESSSRSVLGYLYSPLIMLHRKVYLNSKIFESLERCYKVLIDPHTFPSLPKLKECRLVDFEIEVE